MIDVIGQEYSREWQLRQAPREHARKIMTDIEMTWTQSLDTRTVAMHLMAEDRICLSIWTSSSTINWHDPNGNVNDERVFRER